MLTIQTIIGILIDLLLCSIDMISLYLLFRAKKLAPMYRIIQLALVTDLIEISCRLIHDYADQITERENIGPIFLDVIIFIQGTRWYGQLMLTILLALCHFAIILLPLRFQLLTTTMMICIIVVFAVIPALALTIPLFFDCCGFKFYIPGYYWNLDYTKPSYEFYAFVGNVLQVMAIAFLILADGVLLIKLKSFTVRKVQGQQASSISAIQLSRQINERKKANSQFLRWLRGLRGETRLSFCLALYTLGFLSGNINFNILSKFSGPLIQVLNSVLNIAYYLKFVPYAITARL